MSERTSRLLAALLLLATPAGAATDPAALLSATDLFAAAPDEMRLELEVGVEGDDRRMPLEIYRSGPDHVLVRFLDPAERGKFVLRSGAETWFLAPGAKRPVRMGNSFRLHGGAAIDDLVGLELARDYRIDRYFEEAGVGTFDLVVDSDRPVGAVAFPRIRWAVDLAKRLPLRAELRSATGRALRILELRSWLDAKRLIPGEIAVTDLVRRGAKIAVRFTAVEAGPLDPRLFSPEDAATRAALPAPSG